VLRVAGGPVTKIPVQQNYRWYNKFTVGLQVGGSWPPGASSSWSFVLVLGWCARIFQTMDARWCPCRGGQSDRWRTDGTGDRAPRTGVYSRIRRLYARLYAPCIGHESDINGKTKENPGARGHREH
jgi:hypothetical protein